MSLGPLFVCIGIVCVLCGGGFEDEDSDRLHAACLK